MANTTMSGVGSANNYLTSGASASAAGQMGSANAIGNAIQSGIGNWMGMQMIDRYNPGAAVTAGAPAAAAYTAPAIPALQTPNYGLTGPSFAP